MLMATETTAPCYRDLVAGQVIRPTPGRPYMLAMDPKGADDGLLVSIVFSDGSAILVDPDESPMDVVTYYDYEIDSTSPGDPTAESRWKRDIPVRGWAHPDDLEVEVARLRSLGHTEITWRLRAVCEETYRLCYSDRQAPTHMKGDT